MMAMPRSGAQQTGLPYQVDRHGERHEHGKGYPARQRAAWLLHRRFGLLLDPAEFDDIIAHAALSTRAVTPCPPAVHTEINARLPGSVDSSFAVSPRIRAPVAANGCP